MPKSVLLDKPKRNQTYSADVQCKLCGRDFTVPMTKLNERELEWKYPEMVLLYKNEVVCGVHSICEKCVSKAKSKLMKMILKD